MESILAALNRRVRDIKAQPGVIRTVRLLDLNLMEIQASLPLVNHLTPKASQVQTVEEKKTESILLVHTLRRKTKIPQSTLTLTKGLLVTLNLTGIRDTPHRAHPDRIAKGQGQGRSHVDLGLVHLTQDRKDPEETEAPALSGHIIMTLTGGRTGPPHAEREGDPARALKEIAIVQILRMTTGKQEQGQVNQADRQPIQVHIKSLDSLLM